LGATGPFLILFRFFLFLSESLLEATGLFFGFSTGSSILPKTLGPSIFSVLIFIKSSSTLPLGLEIVFALALSSSG
jgi:hypothetical protein